MIRFLVLFLLGLAAAHAQPPPTTTAPTTLLNSQCSTTQALFGGGVGLPPTCSALNYSLMPALSANQVLGALTATNPSGLTVPSCSGSTNALIYTSGVGFGCNSITSATSTPGALNLSVYPGVVVGNGQNLATQQANCTNMNSAIAFAVTNGLELDAPAGVYQYNCAGGLIIPFVVSSGTGFKWRGSRAGTVLLQMYATSPGGPALTIGDPTGTNVSYGIDFDGATVRYGASQTGNTSAETVIVGAMTNSRITGLTVGAPSNANPGYDGILLDTGSSPTYTYNNASDWYVNGAQHTLLNATNALGAGNNFSNIYLSNGASGTYGTLSGFCMTLGTTIGTETKFTSLDCTWASLNIALDLEDAVGLVIDNLHLQGIKSTGASPILVQTVASDLRIGSMQVQDWFLQSGNVTGTPKVFRDASATPSNLQVHSLNFLNTVSGNVNTPFTVISPDAPADDNGTYSVNQMRFQDTAGATYATNVNIDSHMPTASTRFLTPERVGQYSWGQFGSTADKAVIPVTATYTHYGELTGATIEVPASVTSFTITLQAVQGASGNAPVGLGTVVHVRRQAGSASGTLTVTDDTPTTLTTNTTAAQDFWYIFNGTHFVTYTPVT